jgi:hypothetical protein
MKKQIRQFTKYAARLIACALLICIVSAVEIPAQKKPKPTPKERVYWYVDYTVTVKGNGSTIPKDGYTTTVWSINRTYSAVLKLTEKQAQLFMGVIDPDEAEKAIRSPGAMQVLKSGRFIRYMTSAFKPAPTRVKIVDTVNLISIRKTKCLVKTTTGLTTWEADETFDVVPNFMLHTDEKSLTYNVLIPIVFMNPSKDTGMTMLSKTEIDRSYSCPTEKKEPAHEETIIDEKQVSINSLDLPKVKGLIGDGFLEGSVVEHKPDKPWPPNFLTAWEYDSGDMMPNEPLIAGVPDSKTNVKVRVRYRFSKTPIY